VELKVAPLCNLNLSHLEEKVILAVGLLLLVDKEIGLVFAVHRLVFKEQVAPPNHLGEIGLKINDPEYFMGY
jgi:hypothetical protein